MKPTITLLLTGLIGLVIQPSIVKAEEYHLGFRIAPRISTLGGGLKSLRESPHGLVSAPEQIILPMGTRPPNQTSTMILI